MTTRQSYIGNTGPIEFDSSDTYPDNGQPVQGIRIPQGTADDQPTLPKHLVRLMDLDPLAYKSIWLPVEDITNPIELQEKTGLDAGIIFAYQEIEDEVDKFTMYIFDPSSDYDEFIPYRVRNEDDEGTWIAVAGEYKLSNMNIDGNIFPATTETYAFGTSLLRFLTGHFKTLSIYDAPVNPTDGVNKAYADSLGSGGIQVVSVSNIANPSTELNLLEGSISPVLLATQALAGSNISTLYLWDSSNSDANNAPYIIAGSAGKWIAIAGRYRQGSSSLTGGIAADSLSLVTDLSVGGDITVVDDVNVGGDLAVTGTAALGATTITGNMSSSGNASITGHANILGMPCVRARQDAAQSIPNNSTTTLTNWVEDQDIGSAFNATTGLYTVPSGMGGPHLITGKNWFAYNANGLRALDVIVNGTPLGRTAGYDNANVPQDMAINLSHIIDLAAGDTVGLCVFQTSGGALLNKVALEGDKAFIEITKLS